MNNARPKIDITQASQERTPSPAEQGSTPPIGKPERLSKVEYNLIVIETALKDAAAQIATIRQQTALGNYHVAARRAAVLGIALSNARTYSHSTTSTLDALYLWVDGLDQEK